MIGLPHALLSMPLPSLVPLAAGGAPTGAVLSPVLILVLCVVAGVGTVLALPSRREVAFRAIGGVVLLAAGLILAAVLINYAAQHGGGMGVYFWIFSTIAIVGALRVITHNRPVYSALYFVLTVLASAGLFVLMWAEFMAAALVLIYAGAILITYVFVIMLASQATAPVAAGSVSEGGKSPLRLAGLANYDLVSREPVIACAVGFALMGILLFVTFDQAAALPQQALESTTYATYSTQELGHYLFRSQLITLELAGVILTIAMVGAIVIARRNIRPSGEMTEHELPEVLSGPATPLDDDPHSIPVYGTRDRRQKEYPET